ncbi:glycosyltransferase [Azospirillum sp. YIM B02556]|uniref:Glycosyltransferase n=1 Tax=Azospirillum endophyticum TaxID=2800326 RepID=A0ABS1FEL9_9PROT|nr:glycosyltransferase [Azospirillum endophyticum]MBK1841891.1 glycosyltransferase [Azospirillum endophyticum]
MDVSTRKSAEDFADAVDALAAAMRRPVESGSDLRAIEALLEPLRQALPAGRAEAVLRLAGMVQEVDPVLRLSALAAITGDLRHYEDLFDLVEAQFEQSDLDRLLHIQCCIGRQLFLMRMDAASRPGFFEDRLFPYYIRLIGAIRRRLGIDPRPRPPGNPATGRVMLVTNQFLSLRHQPSRDLLSYATVLEERCGRDVVILNTNIMPADLHSLFVPSFAASIEPAFDGKQVIEAEGRSYRMLSSTGRALTRDKVDWFLRAVDWHDPDVVVSLGGSVVVADLLAAARPTLCIPTTSGLTPSLAGIVLDYGGGSRPAGGPLAASWRPSRFLFSLIGTPPPVQAAPAQIATDWTATARAESRAGFGLPDDAFLCVVIGNRLDEEADGAFLSMLDALIDRVPRAAVAFAGEAAALAGRLHRARHAGRLFPLGYVSDMTTLLRVADAYVNPRRTGGGASAAAALAAGVVPVSLPAGDVAAVIGPRFVVPDYAAALDRLALLAEDPAAFAAVAAEARSRGAGRADPAEAAAALSRYLDEAVAVHRPLP